MSKMLLQKSNKTTRFLPQIRVFSCFAPSALAQSQQLPDNSEVKMVGARDITDLMFF
jgi:hypothetical protein